MIVFAPEILSSLDYISLSFAALLLCLSLFSLCFIFFLRLRSLSSVHLRSFNSLWAVRSIFVLFVALWAVNELVRPPYIRLTQPLQANLCKAHVFLSLGLLQPGFFVTLLFLVNVSVDKTSPRISSAVVFIFLCCLPISILQLFVIEFPRLEVVLPEIFYRSSVVVKNPYNDGETVLCAFPLLGTLVFAAFGVVYSVFFVMSCWKLMSVVINKALRIRIYVLTMAVLVTLPVEMVFLGLSVLWTPERAPFGASASVVFLSTCVCAVAGEDILVIRPITDSLAAEADGVRWSFRRREDHQESAV